MGWTVAVSSGGTVTGVRAGGRDGGSTGGKRRVGGSIAHGRPASYTQRPRHSMVRGGLADLARALRQSLSVVLCGSCNSQLNADYAMRFLPTLDLYVVFAHRARREQSASRIVVYCGCDVAESPCPCLRAGLRAWDIRDGLQTVIQYHKFDWEAGRTAYPRCILVTLHVCSNVWRKAQIRSQDSLSQDIRGDGRSWRAAELMPCR